MVEENLNINNSARTARRKQLKTLGSDAVAYIIELVTNADDSYRRLEAAKSVPIETKKIIYIDIYNLRGNTLISVIDNAEGMSSERVKNIFTKYGEENSGGELSSSRGIFGQGATDVMVNSAMDGKQAMLESFKDDEFCKFYFDWDSEKGQRILRDKTPFLNSGQKRELRNKLKIPINGTRMTFGVPSSVKFKEKSIVEELNGAYSLRYILNSSNREVILNLHENTVILSSQKYSLSNLPLIKEHRFKFTFSEIEIDGHLQLFKNIKKQELNEFATNILVIDGNRNVYANTLFGFEKMPRAKDICGILVIDGIYELAKYHLNKQNPDEVINDDRTGFNTRHEFYKTLTTKYLDSVIRDAINEHGAEIDNFDFSKNKKFKDALAEINNWISEELEEEFSGGGQPGQLIPTNGLDFGRISITITEGKTCSLKLKINSFQVFEEDDIFIELFNNFDNILLSSTIINYKNTEVQRDGLVTKNILIKALKVTNNQEFVTLKVSTKSYSASILIYVIKEKTINPRNGLSFEFDEVTYTPTGKHKSKVWFDTTFFELGTEINFECEGLSIENPKITLIQEMIIKGTLGFFEINCSGGEVDKTYTIKAQVIQKDYNFTQIVHIKSQIPNTDASKGLITNIKGWTENSAPFQITFEKKSGTIYVNFRNPINIEMMGDLTSINPDNPIFTGKQIRYLSDLLAFQSAIIDLKELDRKNQITFHENDKVDDFVNHLDKKKSEIFKRIFNALK